MKPSKSQKSNKPSKPKSSKSTTVGQSARTSKGQGKGARSFEFSGEGFGVKANLKYRSMTGNNNSPLGGPIVVKSEPIGQLIAPAAGNTIILNAHTFQPGDTTMFPWAATQASGFQRYRVRKAGYRFVPTAGVFADQGKAGKVTLYFSYDVNSPMPLDADTTENSKPSLTKMITEFKEMNELRLEPVFMQDTLARGKLVRTSDSPDNYNLGDYDAGKLIVAMSDFLTGGVIGTLFVDYELEWLIAQPIAAPAAFDISRTLDTFSVPYTAAQWLAAGGGTTGTFRPGYPGFQQWIPDQSNAGNVTVAGEVFSLKKGFYLVHWQIQLGDPSGGSDPILTLRSFLTFNPANTQSKIFGMGVPGTTYARNLTFIYPITVTGTQNTSSYATIDYLVAALVNSSQVVVTFLSCT